MRRSDSSSSRRWRRRTRAERARLVEEFLGSELTRAGFSRRHGLSVSSLNRWLAEIAPAPTLDQDQQFREVRLQAGSFDPAWAVEIVGRSGVWIRLQQCPPMEDLLRLLGVSC